MLRTNPIVRNLFLLLLLAVPASIFAQSKAEINRINKKEYQEIVSDVRRSIEIFENNAHNARKIGYKNGEARAHGKLALAYYIAGEVDKSTKSYLKAIELHKELGNKKEVSGMYSEFGYSLKRFNIGKSKKYMRIAINMAEKHGYYSELGNHYNNFGVVHEIDGLLDSAVYYYNKALRLSIKRKDSVGIPYCYENLSGAYAIMEKYDQAHLYLDSAFQYRATEKGEFGVTENYSRRGDLYLQQGRFDAAIQAYHKVLRLANKLDYSAMILQANDKLSESYEKTDRIDSALYFARNFKHINDSLNALEREKELLQLEVAYDAAQKDKEIAEKQLALQAKQTQIAALITIALLLILGIYLVWRWQKSKRKRQKLEAENKIKQEKIRISRELHDNIGSRLTFMISSIENTGFQLEEKEKKSLETVSNFGRNTLQDLRTTVWAMKSESGTLEDLMLRIADMRRFIPDSIQFVMTPFEGPEIQLEATILLNMYRITQEFVQNSLKYAEAKSIGCDVHVEKRKNSPSLIRRR
ncbi:MAG: tetratricopeptide repeat protein [bacterium]|nr:tetratricopeptide repeat protein [bacterium]